jgi:hypothetical protein
MTRTLIRNYSLSVVALLIAVLTLFVVSPTVAQMSGVGQRPAQHAVLPQGQELGAPSQALNHPMPPEVDSAAFVPAYWQGTRPSAGLTGPRAVIFAPAVAYNSGVFPDFVAIGDLNGDGHPDVVLAGSDSGQVSVLLGNGDGTFQAPRTYNSGYAFSVAIGDVNGDGYPDLVVANGEANSVSVLLGNGDGTFQAAVPYSSGGVDAVSVAIADVDGDGHPDVVVANECSGGCGGGSVSVLLGNGDGTFRMAGTYYSGPGGNAGSVAVADVNNDGYPDLIVANYFWVSVLLGNGDGTFQDAVPYVWGGENTNSVAVGDVNGDGRPDLVVGDFNGDTVSVLLGNGDGTFQAPATYSSGGYMAYSVAIADVNGDGYADLAVANFESSSVGVLLGNGDGTFQAPVSYNSGGSITTSVVIADVNGDGKPDLLVANACTDNCAVFGTVGVLLNNIGAPPTTTSLVSSLDPANIKQVVTYTAMVASQFGGTLSGTVTFEDGSGAVATVTLANNQAAYSTSYTGKQIGLHPITATYWGAFRVNEGSQSAALAEYVRSALSKTVVTTSGSPSFVGQPVTITATVTSHHGPIPEGELVTFHEGTTALGSVALVSGTAAYTTSALSAKTHMIKATYAGDATFEPSTGWVTQVVDNYPTTTALGSSSNPPTYGQTVTFTATVTPTAAYPLTGKVWFKDGTTGIGTVTLSGGVATLIKSKLAVGTHPITAQYLGNSANARSTSAVLNQVVQ